MDKNKNIYKQKWKKHVKVINCQLVQGLKSKDGYIHKMYLNITFIDS